MTEKRSHRQTWPMEVDRKITPTNMNGWTWPKYPYFGHIHPLMFVVVIHFRSSSIVHVCRCDLFGHVQIFRSYSFSHIESVKWFFLVYSYLIIVLCKFNVKNRQSVYIKCDKWFPIFRKKIERHKNRKKKLCVLFARGMASLMSPVSHYFILKQQWVLVSETYSEW